MAFQLNLKNVTSCLTEITKAAETTKATETTKESSKYHLKTQNKDGSINHSVLSENIESADDKTFNWVFRHKHPDDETKRVFTIKDLQVEEVTGFNNDTFTVKLNQDQDFTVEYRSNATDTGYIDTGHLYFSISSI